MAFYHFRSQFFSRKKGQSAAAAAAYRIGGIVRDEQFQFSTKSKLLDDLENGVVSTRLRNQFERHGITLSKNATITKDQNRWVVKSGRKSYTIRHEMVGRETERPQFTIFENKSHNYSKKKRSSSHRNSCAGRFSQMGV